MNWFVRVNELLEHFKNTSISTAGKNKSYFAIRLTKINGMCLAELALHNIQQSCLHLLYISSCHTRMNASSQLTVTTGLLLFIVLTKIYEG